VGQGLTDGVRETVGQLDEDRVTVGQWDTVEQALDVVLTEGQCETLGVRVPVGDTDGERELVGQWDVVIVTDGEVEREGVRLNWELGENAPEGVMVVEGLREREGVAVGQRDTVGQLLEEPVRVPLLEPEGVLDVEMVEDGHLLVLGEWEEDKQSDGLELTVTEIVGEKVVDGLFEMEGEGVLLFERVGLLVVVSDILEVAVSVGVTVEDKQRVGEFVTELVTEEQCVVLGLPLSVWDTLVLCETEGECDPVFEVVGDTEGEGVIVDDKHKDGVAVTVGDKEGVTETEEHRVLDALRVGELVRVPETVELLQFVVVEEWELEKDELCVREGETEGLPDDEPHLEALGDTEEVKQSVGEPVIVRDAEEVVHTVGDLVSVPELLEQ